ncbi:DUF1566 domain-containing protein [Photobacterium sp. TY1-4]|uniref:Lcl C-terminal domain-containing protein n=1 Tax=Photobacterium sp. TY1-4 TaxID=2899122 RepID=UPI0021C0E220|nr:DUF1566 domain-containing protein [Photobacterium sp. TY1-4]UXI02570.1 DUF1566 domain-containing protein [Photobacterium sp. TY1-4]
MMIKPVTLFLCAFALTACIHEERQPVYAASAYDLQAETLFPYTVVDSGLDQCFDQSPQAIPCPSTHQPFAGQDAQYTAPTSQYLDNGDGTVTDQTTGLMWQKDATQMSLTQAEETAVHANLGGYSDWRLPSAKELFSLVNFSGRQTVSPHQVVTTTAETAPFIDTRYFEFKPLGSHELNAVFATRTRLAGGQLTHGEVVYTVNFATGQLKAYPAESSQERRFSVRLVRGNPDYGKNHLIDNGDGTISDVATGLMWSTLDSLRPLSWQDALQYADNLSNGGYADWRVPDIKELQSIVDYRRVGTGKPPISPRFVTSQFQRESGEVDYALYWSSTSVKGYAGAATIQFGRSPGDALLASQHRPEQGLAIPGVQHTSLKAHGAFDGLYAQGNSRQQKHFVRAVRNIH